MTYTPDNVGNRLQRSSTLPAITAAGLLNYDANDRISTDSYDANGNTTFNSGQTNVYDFENRLVQRGGVTVVYDGDGNRVKETVAGVTTSYLVADQNPTGYSQVLDELQGGHGGPHVLLRPGPDQRTTIWREGTTGVSYAKQWR